MVTQLSNQSARTLVPWQRLASTPGLANAASPRRTRRPAAAARLPHRHKLPIVANRLILLSPRRQVGAGQNRRIDNLLSRRNGAALTAPVISNIKRRRILRIIRSVASASVHFSWGVSAKPSMNGHLTLLHGSAVWTH